MAHSEKALWLNTEKGEMREIVPMHIGIQKLNRRIKMDRTVRSLGSGEEIFFFFFC